MQRIDVIIVAALVLAAAASAFGVLTYEDDRFATFNIEWTERSEEIEIPGGGLAGPGAGDYEQTIDIARANLTRVVFEVTVGGDPVRLQPVAVRVEVVSPHNNTTSQEGELPAGPIETIQIRLESSLGAMPEASIAQGATLEGARDALNATASSTLGIGTWTIRVSFAPTGPGVVGESYSVGGTATLEYYEAELALVGPEVGR